MKAAPFPCFILRQKESRAAEDCSLVRSGAVTKRKGSGVQGTHTAGTSCCGVFLGENQVIINCVQAESHLPITN